MVTEQATEWFAIGKPTPFTDARAKPAAIDALVELIAINEPFSSPFRFTAIKSR